MPETKVHPLMRFMLDAFFPQPENLAPRADDGCRETLDSSAATPLTETEWRAEMERIRTAHPDCIWCLRPIEQVAHARRVAQPDGSFRLVHSLTSCITLYTAFGTTTDALAVVGAEMRRAS